MKRSERAGGIADGDDGYARADAAALLLGEDRGRDGARVADPADQHSGSAVRCGGDQRGRGRLGIRSQNVAELDGVDGRRRQAQDVDHHDDVGRREAGEALDTPFEADLIRGLIERMLRHHDSLGGHGVNPAAA